MCRIYSKCVFAVIVAASSVSMAEPTADAVLAKVDSILSPPEFESKMTFISHKASGETRTYGQRILKKDSDKFRIWFLSPADDVGQEVLRIGDDMWSYMPNLKRSLKISGKQEFHGGDFANTDVLRVDLSREYTPSFLPSAPDVWLLELKAKNDKVTYAKIAMTVRRSDNQPTVMEFFTGSGKMVRKMELYDLKSYGGLVRPSKFVMRNMLEPKRYSELIYETLALRKDIDRALFEQSALGR